MHDSNLLLPAHDLHNVFEGYVLCIQFIQGISTFASQKTAQFTYHSGPCPVVTWEDPIPPISFLPSFLPFPLDTAAAGNIFFFFGAEMV